MPRAKAETTKHLEIAKKHPKGKAIPPKAHLVEAQERVVVLSGFDLR